MKTPLAFFFALVFVAANSGFLANAADNAAKVTKDQLAGHQFLLESIDGVPFAGEQVPSIEFNAELEISGIVCNRFRGKASLEGDSLLAERLISTRMACPNEKLAALESRLLGELEKGIRIAMDSQGNLLLGEGNAVLKYKNPKSAPIALKQPADEVTRMKFILREVDGAAFTSERQPTIEFDAGLRVSGRICNNFMGQATIENGKLFVRQAAATMMMCPDENLTKLEGRFHRMLAGGAEISFDGKTLKLVGSELAVGFTAAE